MKVYLHLEGTPDLTWLAIIDNPQERKIQSLIKGFCKAFEEAHPLYRGLPVLPDTVELSKSASSAKRKIDPESTVASNLSEGSDVFVHIDVDKATEARKRMAVKKVEMVKPEEPTSSKKDKKPKASSSSDRDMLAVQKHIKAREIRTLRDKCKQMLEEDKHSVAGHYGMAQVDKVKKDWDSVVIHLDECVRYAPDNLDLLLELADSQLEAGELQDALKTYQRGLTFTGEDPANEQSANFQIGAANTMIKAGRYDTARDIIVNVLRKNENHVRGLLSYADFFSSQDKEEEEQLKIMLRLIVADSENKEYRERMAKLLSREQAITFIRTVLPPNAASAPAYALLATIARDFSQISAAEMLYLHALEARGFSSASYALSLVHVLELHCSAAAPLMSLSQFLLKNRKLSVGGVSCQSIYDIIRDIVTMPRLQHVDDETQPRFLSIPYTAPPDIDTLEDPNAPATTTYTEEERDLLALFFTAAKVLYWTGFFDQAAQIAQRLGPLRHGAKLHMTQIRNENSYFGCIEQLLQYAPREPAPESAPLLYVIGDSHTLPLAWRHLSINGVTHVLRPLLVTGCKCWHLRPDSKFYPKFNFEEAISRVPNGSRVMFVFGEIDCREGMLLAVDRGYHDSMRDAMVNTIRMYTKLLSSLAESKNLDVFVHPAAPVLNPTRHIVLEFDSTMPTFVSGKPRLRWLQFHTQLLDSATGGLLPQYRLDDTHLNPAYLPVLEAAINQALKAKP